MITTVYTIALVALKMYQHNCDAAELAALSLKLDVVLFVHLYLADMSHFAAANGAYRRHFPAVSPAARACVEVHLPPGCSVMLEVLLPSTVAGNYHGQVACKVINVSCGQFLQMTLHKNG